MTRIRPLLALVVGLVALAGLAGPSSAQTAPASAVSYVNGDGGENPDVEASSSCETPDQNDMQPTGDVASGENNVHNDACLLDADGNKIDTAAAFEIVGPAQFSACPDPDGDGPKTATNQGNICLLSGFEADNMEYHARFVGTGTGIVQVTFCADPENNGCSDATVSDLVIATFQGDASGAVSAPADPAASSGAAETAAPATPTGAVAAGEAPAGSDGLPLLPVAAAGALALAGSVLWSRRQRA